MKEITVISNQSLFDIAIQECGTVSAVLDIAMANNISITQELIPGQKIKIPLTDKVNKDVINYFKGKRQAIATQSFIPSEDNSEYLYQFPIVFQII